MSETYNCLIRIGDIVSVNFHNSQYTLCSKAEVVFCPGGPGESWVFRDRKNNVIFYVSEGCTIAKQTK